MVYKAGEAILAGHSNTFVGYEAGSTFDGGESNMTAVGRNAMGSHDNESSSNCVALGVNALEGGTGAITNNIAIGKDSMSSTSNRNVDASIAIGLNAMDSTFGGCVVDCIAIGRDSMHHASNQLSGVTGSIGIGKNTLQALTTGDGNIAIGHEAGDTCTVGINNIIIGKNADVNAIATQDAIIIGKDATPTSSNQIILGSSDQTSTIIANAKSIVKVHDHNIASGGSKTITLGIGAQQGWISGTMHVVASDSGTSNGGVYVVDFSAFMDTGVTTSGLEYNNRVANRNSNQIELNNPTTPTDGGTIQWVLDNDHSSAMNSLTVTIELFGRGTALRYMYLQTS